MKHNKKAFTVVELVVVIAILAILAAVLIPTFVGLVEKANESNTLKLVKNLNTALRADKPDVASDKHETMYDALMAAKGFGYDVEKINANKSATGDNEILWDSVNDCFVYVRGNDKVYAPETLKVKDVAPYQYWTISDTVSETYSTYLYGFTGTEVTAKAGIDAGEITGITKINYVGNTTAQTVAIRTNGGSLTVDAAKDTVYHYGGSERVDVIRCAMNSFHEFGTVSGNINLASGRVVVEIGANVKNVVVMALTTADGTKVTPAVETVAVKVADPKAETKVADACGVLENVEGVTKENATVVTTYEELKSAFSKGGIVVLGADITATKQLKVNGGVDLTIELNGYTIKGCTSLASFAVKGKLTINGQGRVYSESQLRSLFYVYEGDGARGELIINGGTYELLKNNTGANKSPMPLIQIGDSMYNTQNGDIGLGGIVTINGGSFVAREFCLGASIRGELTVNGGTFTSLNNAVISTQGDKGFGNNKIVVNGGTFNANIIDQNAIACGIYLANKDELTVNGGTFNITNGCGILVRSGKATIGKDVKIFLNNDGSITEGTVGDSKVKISTSSVIVRDEKAEYPGGVPEVVNNSEYTVIDNTKQ